MDLYILLGSVLNKLSANVNTMHERLQASFVTSCLLTCINKLVAENKHFNLDCGMICFITTTVDSQDVFYCAWQSFSPSYWKSIFEHMYLDVRNEHTSFCLSQNFWLNLYPKIKHTKLIHVASFVISILRFALSNYMEICWDGILCNRGGQCCVCIF